MRLQLLNLSCYFFFRLTVCASIAVAIAITTAVATASTAYGATSAPDSSASDNLATTILNNSIINTNGNCSPQLVADTLGNLTPIKDHPNNLPPCCINNMVNSNCEQFAAATSVSNSTVQSQSIAAASSDAASSAATATAAAAKSQHIHGDMSVSSPDLSQLDQAFAYAQGDIQARIDTKIMAKNATAMTSLNDINNMASNDKVDGVTIKGDKGVKASATTNSANASDLPCCIPPETLSPEEVLKSVLAQDENDFGPELLELSPEAQAVDFEHMQNKAALEQSPDHDWHQQLKTQTLTPSYKEIIASANSYARDTAIASAAASAGSENMGKNYRPVQTPYFEYSLNECWIELMPARENQKELYALFSNPCKATHIEVSVLRRTHYDLEDYAKKVYSSLNVDPRMHLYNDLKGAVHNGLYTISYEVFGVDNVNYITSNGDDVASILITGDISTGVAFLNSFKNRDPHLLPLFEVKEHQAPPPYNVRKDQQLAHKNHAAD